MSSSPSLDKSGKSQLALSAPNPALINFDRREDYLLGKMNLDILRDRIVMPAGPITPAKALAARSQFETDMTQAKAMQKAGLCETIVIDGGSLLMDIITIVELDISENKNNTYKYAGRNAYLKNLFNELNECGLNVIWTSKARPVWVGDKKIPNLYSPDCHDDIPYMVDVNVQMVTEPSPEGQLFYGVIGTNAFNPLLVGKRFKDLNWKQLMVWLGQAPAGRENAESQIPEVTSPDSDDVPITPQNNPVNAPHTPRFCPVPVPLLSDGDFREVQR